MWIYLVVGVLTIGSLQFISQTSYFEKTFSRVITGGTLSTASYGWLSVYSGFESYLRACLSGDFGNGGYFMSFSLIFLLGVWIWNLVSTRKYIVR